MKNKEKFVLRDQFINAVKVINLKSRWANMETSRSSYLGFDSPLLKATKSKYTQRPNPGLEELKE